VIDGPVHFAGAVRPFAVCHSFDAGEQHTREVNEVTCLECLRIMSRDDNFLPVPDEIPGGYRRAGTMTIGHDGGNFSIKSAVFEHEKCGCLLLPSGIAKHEEFHAEGGREAT
jgi:hypothetical protein